MWRGRMSVDVPTWRLVGKALGLMCVGALTVGALLPACKNHSGGWPDSGRDGGVPPGAGFDKVHHCATDAGAPDPASCRNDGSTCCCGYDCCSGVCTNGR